MRCKRDRKMFISEKEELAWGVGSLVFVVVVGTLCIIFSMHI